MQAESARKASGDARAIFNAVEKFAEATGKSFVRYDESEKVQLAKTMPERIDSSHEFLSALHDISPSLSFTKAAWISAVTQLLQKHVGKKGWVMKDDYQASYLRVMPLRCANICRCVSQGEIKGLAAQTLGRKVPDWVQKLPWWGRAQEAKAGSESGPAPAKSVDMQFGYDDLGKMLVIFWWGNLSLF